MRILALDTSTFEGSVAVLEDERVLSEFSQHVTTHSETLLPLIDRALAAAEFKLEQIDAIGCGAGPGSFTGLRIGLATAKGLCYALHKPLVTISSLEVLAHNVRESGSALIVPIIDARKQQVFVGFFRRKAIGVFTIRSEIVISPEALAADLCGQDALLLGDGALAYRGAFARLRLHSGEHRIRAGELGLLAMKRLQSGQSSDLATAQPTYIRPSDAELGRK